MCLRLSITTTPSRGGGKGARRDARDFFVFTPFLEGSVVSPIGGRVRDFSHHIFQNSSRSGSGPSSPALLVSRIIALIWGLAAITAPTCGRPTSTALWHPISDGSALHVCLLLAVLCEPWEKPSQATPTPIHQKFSLRFVPSRSVGNVTDSAFSRAICISLKLVGHSSAWTHCKPRVVVPFNAVVTVVRLRMSARCLSESTFLSVVT